MNPASNCRSWRLSLISTYNSTISNNISLFKSPSRYFLAEEEGLRRQARIDSHFYCRIFLSSRRERPSFFSKQFQARRRCTSYFSLLISSPYQLGFFYSSQGIGTLGAVETIDLQSIAGGSISSKLSMTLILIGMEGSRKGLTYFASGRASPLRLERSLVSPFLPLLSFPSLLSQSSPPYALPKSSCLYFQIQTAIYSLNLSSKPFSISILGRVDAWWFIFRSISCPLVAQGCVMRLQRSLRNSGLYNQADSLLLVAKLRLQAITPPCYYNTHTAPFVSSPQNKADPLPLPPCLPRVKTAPKPSLLTASAHRSIVACRKPVNSSKKARACGFKLMAVGCPVRLKCQERHSSQSR